MDNIRDRFGSRDRMNADRGRDRYDRMDRPERGEMNERGSRRSSSYEPEGLQIDDVASVVEQSNAKQLEVFADCIEDVKDEVYASEKEIMKAIEQVAGSVNSQKNIRPEAPAQPAPMPQPVIDPAMKAELLSAIFGNTDLLNSIREMLEKKDVPEELPVVPEEVAPPVEEAPAENPIKPVIAEFYNNMEDHVHKENVKCYRNVQAALTEQATQIVDQNKKSIGFLKIFAIVNLMLTVVNITLLACYVFGII